MFCTHCGTRQADGSSFCRQCGAPLVAPSAPTPAQPAADGRGGVRLPAPPPAPAPAPFPDPATPPAPAAPPAAAAKRSSGTLVLVLALLAGALVVAVVVVGLGVLVWRARHRVVAPANEATAPADVAAESGAASGKEFSVPAFEGPIGGDDEKERFAQFLINNERHIVNVDVNLSDEQFENLKKMSPEPNKLFIDLTNNRDALPTGYDVYIETGDDAKDFYFDDRPSSLEIKSCLKIVGVEGPQMGIFSITAKAVALEECL